MRIGTRRSALALAQARLVAGLLGAGEIVEVVTSGDRGQGADDRSRWVKELEEALLRGDIDLAVHSAKDVPSEPAQGTELLGAPTRAAAEDALCGAAGLDALAPGARVGTSSIRRAAQLRARRPDLHVVPLRGNVDTRLRGLAGGELDAIVLARAGLQRLGRESEIGALLDPASFVPAPGQGILALQGRAADADMDEAVRAVSDPHALACMLAERAVARELSASCHTPLGAHAWPAASAPGAELESRGALHLRSWVGLPDGSAWACDELAGRLSDPEALGREVASRLKLAGAEEMLARAQEMAAVAGA
jgi:hydroxymethylbilane synthase